MSDLINPRVLKGFRDSLPDNEIQRKQLISRLERTFRLFGFVPIDTPALEYSEILLGKGGGETEKQVYRFEDKGKRDIALRFDLTVPFARYMANHINELYTPFKRYHIAKVWRGENTQKGRYREFFQCDFDIVGTDNFSSDFEILLLMYKSLKSINISNFKIHISNRGIFNRFLKKLKIDNSSVEILRIVDKLSKIGKEETEKLLKSYADTESVKALMDFITPEPVFTDTLKKITELAGGEDTDTERLSNIKQCIDQLELGNLFYLDPSITRGLDYYTGIVFETYLDDAGHIGSVCSGGRYNDLTSLYTKQSIPGVGASIGLDRLIAALNEINKNEKPVADTKLIVLCMDNKFTGYYHKLAGIFRENGIETEVYPEKVKLGKQFQFAEKKSIPLAVICGEEEISKNTVNVKDLKTRESYENLNITDALARIKSLLK
jgi:histidyl-tRNA synthetase